MFKYKDVDIKRGGKNLTVSLGFAGDWKGCCPKVHLEKVLPLVLRTHSNGQDKGNVDPLTPVCHLGVSLIPFTEQNSSTCCLGTGNHPFLALSSCGLQKQKRVGGGGGKVIKIRFPIAAPIPYSLNYRERIKSYQKKKKNQVYHHFESNIRDILEDGRMKSQKQSYNPILNLDMFLENFSDHATKHV